MTATATILIVDDEPGIRALVTESLSAHGLNVIEARNTSEMDRKLAEQAVDLIILDVLMPGEDGISACRRIARENGPPIIMLSAMDQSTDRIVGLEIGADYYLGKPCNPRELLAVVRATLRRRSLDGSNGRADERRARVGFLGWTVDFGAFELRDKEGVLVHLTDGEFVVLRAFVERPRRVLTREQLLDAARGPDSEAFDRAVDVQVSRLRRKLKALDGDLIRTVRNEGYMFMPMVQKL